MKGLYCNLFLFSFFISITVPIFPQYTQGMMYHVLLISMLPMLILPFVLKIDKNILNSLFVIFLLYSILTSLSLMYEDDADFSSVIAGFKIIYFFLYILMACVFATIYQSASTKFINVYYYTIYFSLIAGIIEIAYPSISYFLYKRSDVEILDDKLSSIFNTTYHYAFYLLFGFIHSLICFFERIKRERYSFKKYRLSLVTALIILCFILLTQSRMFVMTAVGFFVSVFVIILMKYFIRPKIFISILVFVSAVCTILIYYIDFLSTKFYYVVNGLTFLFSDGVQFSGGGTGSFNTRVNQILFSLNEISQHPAIGAGTGKGLYLESLYSYLIYKYAFPGLFLYFLCLIMLLICAYKNIHYAKNVDEICFSRTCFYFLLLSPFYFLSGPLFDVPKLSLFYFSIVGIILGKFSINKRISA